MNCIISKQNFNPNCQILPTKTQNIPKQIKQNLNNPERSNKKNHDKKKINFKLQKQLTKQKLKSVLIWPECCYEEEIITFTNSQSTKSLKNYKKKEDNKFYRTCRGYLIQCIYRESIVLQLKPETFFLYVHMLDNFMKTDAGRKLNLDNIVISSYACFFMAQKYEQIYPPSIQQWLPKYFHEKVYAFEGSIVFALNFKFVHESLHNYFEYWSQKFQLNQQQRLSCLIVLESIVFNHDLMYKYEPQKISKVIVLMEVKNRIKSENNSNESFGYQNEKQNKKITEEIGKHIILLKQKIQMIIYLRNPNPSTEV